MSHVEATSPVETSDAIASVAAETCTDIVSVKKDGDESEEAESTSNNLALFNDSEADRDSQYVSKLDGLGPIILNSDGTMGRIPNWSEYTDAEKEQAIRLIAARNKKRKEALLAAQAAKNESDVVV